jgi:hypothetical protein
VVVGIALALLAFALFILFTTLTGSPVKLTTTQKVIGWTTLAALIPLSAYIWNPEHYYGADRTDFSEGFVVGVVVCFLVVFVYR